MVIKVENLVTKIEYTKKVLKDLNNNHFKYETRIARKIINIITLIYISFNIIALVMGHFDYFTVRLILTQVVLLIIVGITNTSILTDISTHLFLKTDKVSLGLKTEMTFDNEKVVAVNEMENMTLTYDKLYRVLETKEYIYLYLNKQQALIVNKGNISVVELALLRDILKSNVKKYIDYMK